MTVTLLYGLTVPVTVALWACGAFAESTAANVIHALQAVAPSVLCSIATTGVPATTLPIWRNACPPSDVAVPPLYTAVVPPATAGVSVPRGNAVSVR